MKCGILTFHDANNYGAVLQAYALQEVVKSLGYDVEIINYRQDYIIKNYKAIRINYNGVSEFIRSIASTIIHYREFINREKVFNQFRRTFLNISNTIYTDYKEISGYDIYISGSDQVWNFNVTNFDEAFFLKFNDKSGVKISYAASIGSDQIYVEEKEFIKHKIGNIDYISVREKSAKEIIQLLTDKHVEKVLDPTLLVDETIWDKLLTSNTIKERYILVYSVGPVENIVEIAEIVRKQLGFRVYYLAGVKIKSKYEHINLKKVTPQEFITLIKNADFIVTNSFHGTAFSLIFNKNFVTAPHKKSGVRMVELLKSLNLLDRIISDKTDINKSFVVEINYESTNCILKNEKEKSKKFLEEALKTKV